MVRPGELGILITATNPPKQALGIHHGGSNYQNVQKRPETHPVNHGTAPKHHLGPGVEDFWSHGTPESTEQENGENFQNNFKNSLAKKHNID